MTELLSRRAYQRSDGLWVFPRDEFAAERFDYHDGEHVVFLGRTQGAGKTTLAFKLLEYCATPQCPALVAVCKPVDKVTTQEGARLGYRRIDGYPVPPKISELWDGKPSGYLIWPDMTDPETAMSNAAHSTRQLIRQVYSDGVRRKHCILVLDDTVTKSKILGLDNDMILIITMSGAMGVGGWFFVQKPTDVGRTALWAYPNCEKVFLSKTGDRRVGDRYDEIGGHDGNTVYRATQELGRYQFLYIERSHGYMCVVDAS
jgi:hypothetical protein